MSKVFRPRQDLLRDVNFMTKPGQGRTYRFTAFQTILFSIIGTTCVKLKPESMTIQHSGAGWPGRLNIDPQGTKEAAELRRWVS